MCTHVDNKGGLLYTHMCTIRVHNYIHAYPNRSWMSVSAHCTCVEVKVCVCVCVNHVSSLWLCCDVGLNGYEGSYRSLG